MLGSWPFSAAQEPQPQGQLMHRSGLWVDKNWAPARKAGVWSAGRVPRGFFCASRRGNVQLFSHALRGSRRRTKKKLKKIEWEMKKIRSYVPLANDSHLAIPRTAEFLLPDRLFEAFSPTGLPSCPPSFLGTVLAPTTPSQTVAASILDKSSS